MKTCPACLTQYTDDTLMYCLQDGSPLSTAPRSGAPTVVLGETETLVNARAGEPSLDTQESVRGNTEGSGRSGTRRGSRTALAVAITALLMLLVFGALGIAAFLYFRDRGSDDRISVLPANIRENRAGSPVSSPLASPTPTVPRPVPTSTAARPVSVDTDTHDEVVSEIESWRETTEDMDLDSLMAHYAPRVDYYNRHGVDPGYIRADKSRAFSRFTDIQMNLSNIQLTLNDKGDKITAVFDKGWRFSGERTSTGKVRQQLELSKLDGRWLITSEKDIKVY